MIIKPCTYIGERFVPVDGRRFVFRRRKQLGRRVPYDSQFRSVDEVFVPVSRRFHVRSVELRDDLGGKRHPGVDAPETVGASPSVAQRVERFQTGDRVHGVPKNRLLA